MAPTTFAATWSCGEDVGEAAFEALRPKMCPDGGLNQLPGYTHPIRGLRTLPSST